MIAKAIVKKAKQVQKIIDSEYPEWNSEQAENCINKFIGYQAIWLISEVHKCPCSITNLKKMIM